MSEQKETISEDEKQMPEEKADKTKRRSFFKMLFDRRWKKVIAGIAVLIVAVLILIPYGIRYSAKRLILAQGGDEAHIDDVDFNPFTGRVALKGLNVKVGDEQHLKISDAEVLLRWWPLFKKRIRVKKVWINDTEMTIETLPEGKFRLGGITAALLKASQKEGEEKESSPWGVGASEITIENTHVKLRMPDFSSAVQVNKWSIRQAFSWQPEQTANVTFDGKINDSPLTISGEVTPFARDRLVKAKINLNGLKTEAFNNLLKASGIRIEGTVSVDANLNMLQKEDGSFNVDHNGAIVLENFGLEKADLKIKTEDFKYDGTLVASLPSNDNVPLTVDSNGELTVTGLNTEAGGNHFKEDHLTWKGKIATTLNRAANKIQAALDGDMNSRKFSASLAGAGLTVEQNELNWKGKLDVLQTADETGINLDGNLAIRDVKADSEAYSVLNEAIKWEGRVDAVMPKKSTGLAVKTDGQFSGGRLELKLPAEQINSRHGAIEWKGKIDYAAGEKGPGVSLDGNLNLDALEFESPDVVAVEDSIQWAGKCAVDLPQEDRKLALLLDGKADLGKLNLRLPANRLQIDQDRFSWNGPLAYGRKPEAGGKAGGAVAQIGDLRITDETGRHLLMGAGKISVEDVTVIGNKGLSGNKLQVNALQMLMPQQAKSSPLLEARSITLESFEIDPENKIEINAVVIDTLESMLKRGSDGQWSFSESLAAVQPPSAETSSQPESKKSTGNNSAPQIRIGKLVIRGSSQIRFEDETVEPAVRTEMALNTLELAELNSTRPDAESPFKLAGKIGKYTEIDFEGTLKPFDERLSMDLNGNVADLELPPLSPYIVNAIGYKFASGQADVDLEMAIDRGQMDGNTKFRFDQLRAKPVDAETLEKLGIKQTIPMETALSLLRDKDGTIKLRVPIKGDIADPKFSVGDAINQALLKATTKASMAYLKYALGPYGIAIAAAEVAYMAATHAGGIRLEPVKFVAGTAEIDPTDQGYVEKLATILKDRPEAKIRVCGLAAQIPDQSALVAPASAVDKKESAAERPPEKEAAGSDGASAAGAARVSDEAEEEAFASTAAAAGSTVIQLPPEQLEALAKARSMAIKDYLVGRHAIKDDRILLCHPEIDKTAGATPRAEILF